MSERTEEYYHSNMFSWEDLVSECISLHTKNKRLNDCILEAIEAIQLLTVTGLDDGVDKGLAFLKKYGGKE